MIPSWLLMAKAKRWKKLLILRNGRTSQRCRPVTEPHNRITELMQQVTPILAAVREGVRAALWRHKCLGHPIVVYRDGKVVHVPASEIKVEPPPPASQ